VAGRAGASLRTAGIGLLVAAALWAGVRALGVLPARHDTAWPAAGLGAIPPFQLTERSGRPVALADLRGSVWVATLFFSRCADTCPLQVARLAALGAGFREASPLRLVAITVDPAHDTPAVLAAYARRLGLDQDRVLLLTGDRAVIADLARRGFHLAVGEVAGPDASGGLLVAHSDRLALVDAAGRLQGTYPSRDPEAMERLHRDLVQVLRSAGPAAGLPRHPLVVEVGAGSRP
jgi:protein SCO1/2